MHANLDRPIPAEELRAWLSAAYGVGAECVAVCQDYADLHRQPPVIARMTREPRGEFPIALEVVGEFADDDRVASYAPRVQALCRRFGRRALVSDESPDPYTWVLIDERGDCSWIDVNTDALDEREEFVVRGPCRAAQGSLATVEPLEERDVVVALAGACHVEERQVEVESWSMEPREGGASIDGTYAIVGSAHYRHFCLVRVLQDPRPWLPERDAAGKWIDQAIDVGRRLDVQVCIHHDAFRRITSIPGGSDSAAHCYHWDGKTLARVGFKTCRDRW